MELDAKCVPQSSSKMNAKLGSEKDMENNGKTFFNEYMQILRIVIKNKVSQGERANRTFTQKLSKMKPRLILQCFSALSIAKPCFNYAP